MHGLKKLTRKQNDCMRGVKTVAHDRKSLVVEVETPNLERSQLERGGRGCSSTSRVSWKAAAFPH